MNDSLKRVTGKNIYKLWSTSEFDAGNSYSQQEDTVVVPAGSRCVLRSFGANSLTDSAAANPATNLTNNIWGGSRVHFLDGEGANVLTIQADAWYVGLIGWSRNDVPSLCNIPCNGLLFDNGLTVRLSAATGDEAARSAPSGSVGVNVNILYGSG
tara:strand:- start:1633 stop:2097 length:465 start_codon:yes stop_codon:yes gene_type:complete